MRKKNIMSFEFFCQGYPFNSSALSNKRLISFAGPGDIKNIYAFLCQIFLINRIVPQEFL